MKRSKRILGRSPRFSLGLAVVVLAGGCGTEPPVPVTIAISPDSATLLWFDETVQLTATAQDLDGQSMPDVTVTWTSGDESVVTVDATGMVTPVGKGVAPVSAAVGTVEGLATVTVSPDRRALLKFYETTGGTSWRYRSNWGTDAPLGTWHGVTTDSRGNVVELAMEGNNITGAIPAEIGVLGALEVLWLTGNSALTGPVPPELGNLRNLVSLYLDRNELTGPIPPGLGDLTELRTLRLSRNALTGLIPPELGNLWRLGSLFLSENALTGPIPPELGNLRGVAELVLDHNPLTGPVPPELGNLQGLQRLAIDDTMLSGPLPRELTGLRRLGRFYWHATDLCSPPDEEFQEWLASIPGRRGNGKCAP